MRKFAAQKAPDAIDLGLFGKRAKVHHLHGSRLGTARWIITAVDSALAGTCAASDNVVRMVALLTAKCLSNRPGIDRRNSDSQKAIELRGPGAALREQANIGPISSDPPRVPLWPGQLRQRISPATY